jgi:hypothetical protein
MLRAIYRPIRKGLVMARRGLFTVAALGTLLGTTALHAQVTPEQVWENWKALATSAGQTLSTGSETRQGDTLVVTGLSLGYTDPETTISSTLDEMRFRDLGDGTVEVTMSPAYTLSVRSTTEDGEGEVDLEVTQANLVVIAGGTPTNATYNFTADSLGLATLRVTEDGQAQPVTFTLTMDRATGGYGVVTGQDGVMDVTSDLTVDTTTLNLSATDVQEGGEVGANATIQALSMSTGGRFGAMMEFEELADALAAGFAVNLSVLYGAVAYDMNVVEDTGPTTIRGKADEGRFGLSLDKAAAAYDGGAKGVELTLAGAELPVPEVVVRYTETDFDIAIPLSKGEAPQEFRLSSTLRDLTVSDEVWALFDPTANLPRDPATLVIDARGTTTLTADLTDEEAMASGAPPGTIESVELSALQLTIAGAELTGSGALTFDNTDLVTFDGMPTPTGIINLALTGGNTLLDKLVAMGLVPDDQAMGARMMMGMFARPGEGPDTLTSTLEFKDKGFFANGMRLR